MSPWVWRIGKLVVLGVLFGIDLWKKELPVWLMVLVTLLSAKELAALERVELLLRLPAAGMLLFVSAIFVKKGVVGGADAWFLALMGLWMNAEEVFFAISVALPTASSCALLCMLRNQKISGKLQGGVLTDNKNTETIPLIPFLVVGYLTAWVSF